MNNLNKDYYTYDDDGKYVHVLPLDDCINSLRQRIIDQDGIINEQKDIIKESKPFVEIMHAAKFITDMFCGNGCDGCPFLKHDPEDGVELAGHVCSYNYLIDENPEEFQKIVLDFGNNRE